MLASNQFCGRAFIYDYVPHWVQAFYLILFNTTNTILENFGLPILSKYSSKHNCSLPNGALVYQRFCSLLIHTDMLELSAF
jgi:hypothetical protein